MNVSQYAQIGMMVLIEHPEIANKLIKQVDSLQADNNGWELNELLAEFCELKQIKRSEICGNNSKREATKHKKIFIAVVLRIYDPAVLMIDKRVKNNLCKHLGEVLGTSREVITYIIQNVKNQMRVYRDFNTEVEYFYSKIIEKCQVICTKTD